jgi:seryl-tRNA synthetase
MIDLELLRKNPEVVKEEIKKRGIKLDVNTDIEQKNDASKMIPKLKGKEKEKIIADMKKLNNDLKKIEVELNKIERKFFLHLSNYPNISHPTTPVGKDEKDNKVMYHIGKKPDFDFKPKNHIELGTSLDILDEKRAAKISGSRFIFLKNENVILEFALIQYILNILIKKGFIPLIPPVLVKEKSMYGTGFFPIEKTQYYKTELDDLYLIGTAEVPLCAYHSDEILDSDNLPLKYTAYSTCFRREAGSYGKDLGGMFRVHQFNKIEMFIFSNPDNSWDEYEKLRETLEDIVKGLKLHYRILNMCTGDIGAPNAKKYDLEVWLPGQDRYREIASCSHDTDFQARRLNIKYKDGSKRGFVHTMNSTACAIGRTLIAIMENYQNKDGSIIVPDVLVQYMGGKNIISNK